MSENNAIIYGFHAVNSILSRRPAGILQLVIDHERHDSRMQAAIALAKAKNVNVTASTKRELTKFVGHEHHQGIIAVVAPIPLQADLGDFLARVENPFLLILDGVQDPHNLGACLRSANAAGVDCVIAPKDRAVGMTPVVSKVASGATFYTPFFQVTNLVRTMEMLKTRGIWLYGTSEHASELYSSFDLTGNLAMVMGCEGKGLRRLTEEHCDFLMRIPMLGTVASLNVSVATGVCLFEAVRQRMTGSLVQ
jgi:23S rRNA (guanosine2251-2'-O)-methyltransferase